MPHMISRGPHFGDDPGGLCQGDRLEKHGRKTALQSRFTSYDAVTAANIPLNTYSASYYADHPTVSNLGAVQARHPQRIMPVVVFASHPAPGTLHDYVGWENGIECDCEPTDLTPAQVGPWCKRVKDMGGDPHVYCPLSSIVEVVASCHAAGLTRKDVKFRTAHWTNVPHICSGIAGTAWGTINADSTQYTDSALGHPHGLDASLCEPWWFAATTPPPPHGHVSASGVANAQVSVNYSKPVGHRLSIRGSKGSWVQGTDQQLERFEGTFDKDGNWKVWPVPSTGKVGFFRKLFSR